MKIESTATVYIVQECKVLLIYHRKLKKWLPCGGHIDPNELPQDAAIREAKEETGLEVSLYRQENVWVEEWNAKSVLRPYLCLLEKIPAFENTPEHLHLDHIYVGYPVGGTLKLNHNEVDDLKWWSLEDIKDLTPNVEIFKETLDVIRHLFQTNFATSATYV